MIANLTKKCNIFIPLNHIRMADFSWSEFLAGSGTAVAIKETFGYIKRKTERKVDMAENARDIAEIHRIMEAIVEETSYNRVVVMCGEDSAGILAAGKNLYITAQYEKINKGQDERLEHISDQIQRWKADTPYYDLYSEMLTKGYISIKYENLPPSKLKDIYTAQNIKSARIYHLMTTKDSAKVFYCSIASTLKDEPSASDRVIIDSAIDKLTNIFKKHQKFY